MENVQDKIDATFKSIGEYINKLPLKKKGKSYIWMHTFYRFYSEVVLTETGEVTMGITTELQLNQFLEQFKKNISKLRIIGIEKYTEQLHIMETNEAVSLIEKQLYKLKNKELLAEIGGEDLSNWEQWVMKYAINELEYQKRRPITKRKKLPPQIISYQWQGIIEKELPEIFKLMKVDFKLIAQDTTLEQFESIFTGKPIDGIVPVKWHENNASEVLYFLLSLEKSNNIKSSKSTNYQKLKACFVKPDGCPFTANFKSIKTNIEINLSKKKQDLIKKLINNF